MKNSINFNEKKREDLDQIFLKLNSENIIEIEIDPTLSKVKKRHLVYINKKIHDLGGGRKMPAYIKISGFILLSEAAIKYRTTSEYSKYRLANAFLIDTFSKTVLYNFYVENDKSGVPVSSFSTKRKAFDWLNSFS